MNENDLPTCREKIEERQLYAVGLKSAGFSLESVYQKVCEKAEKSGWRTPKKSTVEKDIVEYYKRNRALTADDFEYMEAMRESHIAQMETTIEKMSLHIATRIEEDSTGENITKKEWSPFEYADALEKLHKMQMNLAELQNWNRGKDKNTNINFNIQQNTVNAIFDSASGELKKMQDYTPQVLDNFIKQIDVAIDKVKDQEYEVITELTPDDDEASRKFLEMNNDG